MTLSAKQIIYTTTKKDLYASTLLQRPCKTDAPVYTLSPILHQEGGIHIIEEEVASLYFHKSYCILNIELL